jgi:hypothetical protein
MLLGTLWGLWDMVHTVAKEIIMRKFLNLWPFNKFSQNQKEEE